MPDLWIATANPKKLAELQRLLAPLSVRLHPASELPEPFEVAEDRPDFSGNAELKAAALALKAGAVAMGDDSGLAVDALGGRPGVRSSRYAGPGDRERVARLLDELAGVPPARRTARFTCAICLCGPDGSVRARIEEHCPGVILERPRGQGGFGYDPIFVAAEHLELEPPPSFAELAPEQKDAVSHRGRALRRLLHLLEHDPSLLHP